MKIITFGCRMNTFESALMSKLGAEMGKNVIVVNTCAVTQEAERQCRQTIRKLKRENPDAQIVVVGCAVQLNPEVYAQMPEVSRVLGNHEKLDKELLCGTIKKAVGPIDAPFQLPVIHEFEGRNRAFLQIQQGCNHHCTFCVVRLARGKNRGLTPEQIVQQAKIFTQSGFREIVLTGADVVSYPDGLVPLVQKILTEVPQIQRLRFGSLDPAGLKKDFIQLVQDFPQIMPHFHLSIQSGDNDILRKMARRHRAEDVLNLISQIRSVRPESVFGGDFITGFPTETEAQFLHSVELVQRANITHLHVFPYSERPGTVAADWPQVPVQERKKRATQLRQVGQKLYLELLHQTVGQTRQVLVESDSSGWTENYLRVILKKPFTVGQVVKVCILGVQGHELVA